MAVDLNLPPAEDEEDDPFGGLPHGQDHGCGTLYFQQIHDSMAVDLTFLQLKKMTLLEVYLTARTTHLLLEATPWEMLMEHLLSFLTLPYTVDEVDGFNAHCFLLLLRR